MIIESISAVVILGIAIIFLSPGSLTMPESVNSMLILGIIIAFLAFGAFILREKSSDERESVHVLTAGRISYLVGVGVIIAGIVVQALGHEIDPWLVYALCAMVFAKLATRIYSRFKL